MNNFGISLSPHDFTTDVSQFKTKDYFGMGGLAFLFIPIRCCFTSLLQGLSDKLEPFYLIDPVYATARWKLHKLGSHY